MSSCARERRDTAILARSFLRGETEQNDHSRTERFTNFVGFFLKPRLCSRGCERSALILPRGSRLYIFSEIHVRPACVNLQSENAVRQPQKNLLPCRNCLELFAFLVSFIGSSPLPPRPCVRALGPLLVIIHKFKFRFNTPIINLSYSRPAGLSLQNWLDVRLRPELA